MWKFKFDIRTKEFCEGIFLITNNPEDEIWSRLFRGEEYLLEEIRNDGRVLIKARQKRILKTFEDGREIEFEGCKAYSVNTNHDISEMGEYIYHTKGYPVAYIWRECKGDTIVSLRSNTIDVRKLAEKYGGGGHKFAAGFVNKLETESIK